MLDWPKRQEQALRADISIEAFWEMTPRETDMAIEAALWRMEQQQDYGLQMAWLTAALQRTKRMPSLRTLMTKPAKRLQGAELKRRRTEFRRMASPANLAAVNRQRRKKDEG